MPSEVTKLFFKDNQLLAVHKTGFKTFKVNQISSDQFDVNQEYSFDLDLINKFAQIVDDQWLVMTTFPLDQKTWKSDPSISIYRLFSHKIDFSIKFEDEHLFGYATEDYLYNTLKKMGL